MRDILITGGAGKIGFNLVKKLLDTNYSVTILDLESPKSLNKMFGIKDRVKFVYGDVEDKNLVRDLVRKNDFVIDYAGVMPPLANLNEDLSNSTNFGGTKNTVDAIREVNPECIYIYMSFISVYGESLEHKRILTVDTESTNPDDCYTVSLIRSEDYIKSNLKRYVILRMPIVLTKKNYFINHLALGKTVDVITRDDLNEIVIRIMTLKKAYGKTYNVGGIKVESQVLIEGIYKTTGRISVLNRNLYYGEYEDGKKLEELVELRYTNLDDALLDIRDSISPYKTKLRKIINYPKYLIFKKLSRK